MRPHPVIHVETRQQTLKEIESYLLEELKQVKNSQQVQQAIELTVERETLGRVLKFIYALKRQGQA